MLLTSSSLAILHHLFIAGFLATLFGMYVYLKLENNNANFIFFRKLNLWTMSLLISLIIIGIMRASWTEKTPSYYFYSPIFWIKLLSVFLILAQSFYIHRLIKKFADTYTLKKIYNLIFIQMHIFPIPVICAVLLSKGVN